MEDETGYEYNIDIVSRLAKNSEMMASINH